MDAIQKSMPAVFASSPGVEYDFDAVVFLFLEDAVGMFEAMLRMGDRLPFAQGGYAVWGAG